MCTCLSILFTAHFGSACLATKEAVCASCWREHGTGVASCMSVQKCNQGLWMDIHLSLVLVCASTKQRHSKAPAHPGTIVFGRKANPIWARASLAGMAGRRFGHAADRNCGPTWGDFGQWARVPRAAASVVTAKSFGCADVIWRAIWRAICRVRGEMSPISPISPAKYFAGISPAGVKSRVRAKTQPACGNGKIVMAKWQNQLAKSGSIILGVLSSGKTQIRSH
jgi:hypothetical protein